MPAKTQICKSFQVCKEGTILHAANKIFQLIASEKGIKGSKKLGFCYSFQSEKKEKKCFLTDSKSFKDSYTGFFFFNKCKLLDSSSVSHRETSCWSCNGKHNDHLIPHAEKLKAVPRNSPSLYFFFNGGRLESGIACVDDITKHCSMQTTNMRTSAS